MFYLTIFIPLSVLGKIDWLASGFFTCAKLASFGLLCAWREVLISRQQGYLFNWLDWFPPKPCNGYSGGCNMC
jgi:hypothetical protein